MHESGPTATVKSATSDPSPDRAMLGMIAECPKDTRNIMLEIATRSRIGELDSHVSVMIGFNTLRDIIRENNRRVRRDVVLAAVILGSAVTSTVIGVVLSRLY